MGGLRFIPIIIASVLLFPLVALSAPDEWISPTGYSDPDSIWSDEPNAYDGDTGTFAYTPSGGVGSYIELSLGDVIASDKVRIYATTIRPGVGQGDPNIDVDVYYSGSWHNIHSGQIALAVWVELPVGSTQQVSGARIKWNLISSQYYGRIFEFDFYEVAVEPAGSRLMRTVLRLVVAATILVTVLVAGLRGTGLPFLIIAVLSVIAFAVIDAMIVSMF